MYMITCNVRCKHTNTYICYRMSFSATVHSLENSIRKLYHCTSFPGTHLSEDDATVKNLKILFLVLIFS
jgi:hypothetical protein